MRKEIQMVLKSQSGAALVIALITMVVLTLIVLTSTFTSNYEIKLSGNKRGATNAFYGADSGVQITMANIGNFDLPGKYVDEKYDPFTDTNNPNPAKAKVMVEHNPNQKGAPRGFGISAINVGFEHYLIESKGEDQIESNPLKSRCMIHQKVVRMVPTLQGGY